MKNVYTRTWFELFLETRPTTELETDFVVRQLPDPPYHTILDLCCGQGRHANRLAARGYAVTGVDVDVQALAIARQQATAPVRYLQHDMRHLKAVDGSFDAVILLWQSFGYFDEATNADILGQINRKLNPGGRLLLDIYNRNYWEQNQGSSRFARRGMEVTATNTMAGNRLTCDLVYGQGQGRESFDWQLYSADEITELAGRYGLICLLSCCESDESKQVDHTRSQMQFVFERS